MQNLRPKPGLAELYLTMMEATFKTKEGDQEQQLVKLKSQQACHEANLLKFDQQRNELQKEKPETLSLLKVFPGMCRSQDSFRTFKEFDWGSLQPYLSSFVHEWQKTA